jgi:hypothetical protein
MRKGRSTGDTLILMIAGTVCVSVLLSVLTVVVLQFIQPDNKGGFAAIADVINTLISLMAGFLAGRTDAVIGSGASKSTPPPAPTDSVESK